MVQRLFGWLVILAGCAAVVAATRYGFSPISTSGPVEWRLIDVPPHTSASDLADRLQGMGIIRSKVCFLVAARLRGESGILQPGQYKVSPSMGPVDIVEKIARGEVATEWVVFPEGATVNEIEHVLQDHSLVRRGKFDSALHQNYRYYRPLLHITGPNLEGYLFPDTYHFTKTMPELAIVRTMVERFRKVVLTDQKAQIQGSTNGLSFSRTMILASLVEKEARHDDERSHIAGVLLNRLRNGSRLDCDATIEYILPHRKAHLAHEDLEIESPYNTYLHRGLPPGPICCPGLASILAALRPAATRDLYYVAQPDGYHIFSQTLAEHDHAIQKVKQMRADEGE